MKRIFLDVLLLVLFLAVMSFHALPKLLHEVLGLLLPLTVFLHLFLNRRWFSALFSGKWTVMRVMSVSVNLLLVICLFLVAVTGICLSNHLFKDMIPLALQRNITLHQLHVSLPFAMLLLMGIHFGFHWQVWKQRLLQFFHWEADFFAYRWGSRIMTIAFIGLGIYGSLQNRIGDRLLMKHIFATPATDLPGVIYALLLFFVFSLYACLGNVSQTLWQRWRNRKQKNGLL